MIIYVCMDKIWNRFEDSKVDNVTRYEYMVHRLQAKTEFIYLQIRCKGNVYNVNVCTYYG